MKKTLGVVGVAWVVAALSVAPVYGDASQNGCEHSNNRAAGCSDNNGNQNKKDPTSMPEPGSLGLLAAGIVGVSCLGYVIRRKRLLES